MKCYKHEEIEAAGTCVKCGKAVCSACALIVNGQVTCPDCAVSMASGAGRPGRKEPVLAALLSFLLAGLGQIYNGQVKKGVICIVTETIGICVLIVLYVIVSILTGGIGGLCCLPFVILLPWIIVLYAMYDSYVTAERINQGETVADWF